MLLSVGMIVKNEEKFLERCLKSLLPLKDKIDFEIVIVDTGSTDKTKEIAYKYTDKIYDFEWINDFSAARNYGLGKCTGEWFMFLDADHEIEDCQPLIDFLLNEESKKYNSVSLLFKNYLDDSLSGYLTSYFVQLARNNNLIFKNKIHEVLNVKEPIYNLNCIVHHYGYIGTMDQKDQRNDSIIDAELEEHPNDTGLIGYKVQSLYRQKKYDEIIKIEENCNFKEFNMDYYKINSYSIISCCRLEKWDDAKEKLKILEKRYSSIEYILSDVYAMVVNRYNELEENDELFKDGFVKEICTKYINIYERFKRNEVNITLLSAFGVQYLNSRIFLLVCLALCKHYATLENYNNVFEILDKAYRENEEKIYLYNFELKCIKKSNCYERLNKVLKSLTEEEKRKYIQLIQSQSGDQEHYLKIMEQIQIDNTLDVPLLKEYARIIWDKATKEDYSYFAKDTIDELYVDVIYYFIKNNKSLDGIKWLRIAKLRELSISKILFNHKDSTQIIINHIEDINELENVRMINFYSSLIYQALCNNQELPNEDYLFLLNKYINWQMKLASYIYNESLFDEDKLIYLPSKVRYCYYMEKANLLIDNNNYKEAMGNIRLAMSTDENLARGCELLLPKLEEKKENEFESYARKIKDVIVSLINTGKSKDAFVVYQQYKKINPKDTELDKYFMK